MLNVWRKDLQMALTRVLRVIPARTTKPILECALLQWARNELRITGYNLETAFQIVVEAEVLALPGAVAIAAKGLNDLVKKLSGDVVKLEVRGLELEIRSGKAKFTLHAQDAAEYPVLPDLAPDRALIFSGAALEQAVERTAFAAQDPGVTSRVVLSGVKWSVLPQGVQWTATDTHRLAQVLTPLEEVETGLEGLALVVPAESLRELAQAAREADRVDIGLESAWLMARWEKTTFYTRLLEGSYPEVDRLIPRDFSLEVQLNCADLTAALERMLVLAGDEHRTVLLDFGAHELRMSVSADRGQGEEPIAAEVIRGTPFRLTLNGRFLLNVLKIWDEEQITLRLTGPKTPVVLATETQQHLLLPVTTLYL